MAAADSRERHMAEENVILGKYACTLLDVSVLASVILVIVDGIAGMRGGKSREVGGKSMKDTCLYMRT